jgi:protein O-mannosyl-transferase
MKKAENKNTLFPFNSAYWLILVFAFVIVAYLPTFTNVFTNWDDIDQVTGNADIQSLGFSSLKKMFSSFYVGMYQPLTTLAYSLIYKMGKFNASWYHAFSLAFHLLNIILAYILVKKISGKNTVAIIAAFLFAVSPMQNEAVAWVSATSSVLYTLFFLASANLYLGYIENRTQTKYWLSFVLFLFSLLSKSAAVTLPLILILFDYFRNGKIEQRDWLNKIPFFVLSIIFGIITIYARKQSGHIVDIAHYYHGADRIFMVIYSFAFYFVSDILPLKLSAFHPYPSKMGGGLPLLYYLAPLLLLLIVFAIYKFKSFRKELLFGILFFLLTIFVMMEIIPVGVQIVKERYTYISCIGLYFVIGMIAVKISEKYNAGKIITAVIILAGCAFTYVSYARVSTWKNSYTLWNDVIKKYPKCSAAYINRGNAYVTDENYEKAISDFTNAIKYEPLAADAYIDRAVAKSNSSDIDGALDDYDIAISIGPATDKMYSERAVLKLGLQDVTGAYDDFSAAIKLDSTNEKYYNQRGIIFGMSGKLEEAITDFSKAIELSPEYADAYSNRGLAEMSLTKNDEAINDFSAAIEKNSFEARTYFLRGLAYEQKGNLDSACVDLKKADTMGFDAAAEEIERVCK